MSNRPTLLLCSLVVIAILCGLYIFSFSDNEKASLDVVENTAGESNNSEAVGDRLDQIPKRSRLRNTESGREITAPYQNAGWEPYASAPRARDFLTEVVQSNSWIEEVVEANVRAWARPCKEAGRFGSYANLPADQRRNFGPAVEFGVEFWRYCDGLIDAESGQPDEELIRELQEASSGPGDPAGYHWSRIADVNAAGDFELLKDLAVSRLDQSLRNLDEVSVRSSIFALLRPQNAELVNLPPEFGVEEEAYADLFLPVVHPVASALICQELGGCYGSNHPLVLRTCIEAMGQRVGCVNPTDLIDALYQTQTPVEHRLFWSLFDQVNGMLAAYRRN